MNNLKDQGMKYCHRCDSIKPIDDFTKLNGECRSNCVNCTREINKEFYLKNHPKYATITCECGQKVTENHLEKHKTSKTHLDKIKVKETEKFFCDACGVWIRSSQEGHPQTMRHILNAHHKALLEERKKKLKNISYAEIEADFDIPEEETNENSINFLNKVTEEIDRINSDNE